MRVSILQQDLMPALTQVSRSVGARSQLPVLGNILLSALGGELKLSATNLEVGVVRAIKAEVEEEGEVTIPAKTLVEVVGNLSGEKVLFVATSDQAQISTPTFSATLNGIPASEFPSIPLVGQGTISVEAEVLLKSLPQVTFSAALDEGRPILTGILTEIKDGKLQLVATDGYRLAHKLVSLSGGSSKDTNFKALVPRRTFEEVVRIIGEDPQEVVEISTSEDGNQLIFSFGSSMLSSRLIEGQFPVWEKIIPAETQAKLTVDRGEMLKAVKLASVFARNEANVVKMENLDNKLTLSSEAKELGSQKKEIEVKNEGEGILIAFNTKFLLDVLGSLSANQIEFQLSGPLSAALIKPVGEEGLEYIIMPVNLS